MTYEPKLKNKAPDVWVLALFLCGAVCAGFGFYSKIKGGGILQTLALFFLCAAVYVLIRFRMTRVHYVLRLKSKKGYGSEDKDEPEAEVLRDDEGKELPLTAYPPERLEIVIEKAQGKRGFVAEALVALDDITAVAPFSTKEEKKALRQSYPRNPMYKYIRNMVGYTACAVVTKTPAQDTLIVIEPSEKLFDYLRAVARYNRDKSDKSGE